MFTDTHCHMDLNKFDADRELVLQRAMEAGVGRMLVPGLDLDSSRAAVDLAESHPGIRAAVGFHPTDIGKLTPAAMNDLHELANRPCVAAIGEIGLDYYWVESPEKRLEQRQKLPLQLELAGEVNKPIILHLREQDDAECGEATKDLFDILELWQTGLRQAGHPLSASPGVFHSFNGNLESAQRAIEMNYYIGITGPVTYRKADSQRELVSRLPLDRMLIETDSPFQTPHPHRGSRNEPANVVFIADKIAELHHTSREQVAKITSQNASRLFGWEADT
jgi:TatD DNase family protein